jgi:putative membrane protein
MQFVVKWLINTVALFIVIHLVAGVSAESWQSVVVAAFLIGLFNAFLRPFVLLLTLPINILSLGLFTLVINGFFFYAASKFVTGFTVLSFWNAVWASLIFSVISFILSALLTPSVTIDVRPFAGRVRRETPDRYTDVIDIEGHIEKDKQETKELK